MHKRNFHYLLTGLLLITFVSACGTNTSSDSLGSGGGSSGSSCSFTGECNGSMICAASRVCTIGSTCNCVGSTSGRCIDLGVSACTLSTGSCATLAACCNGLSCNDGKCQGPSGSCPFSLF